MKKFVKIIIVISLLGGLILAVGKGEASKSKPMSVIDPGAANGIVR